MGMHKINVKDRFWSKVQMIQFHTCWEWSGFLDKDGYGNLFVERTKPIRAHRFSWLFHFGEIPEGLRVCHKCDNRSCVNPDHLFLGTAKDNTHDMYKKRRDRWSRFPSSNPSPRKRDNAPFGWVSGRVR